jgi:hypothetical protein
MNWNFHTELRPGPPNVMVWRWSYIADGKTTMAPQTFIAFRDSKAHAMRHGMEQDAEARISYIQPDDETAFPKRHPDGHS